jgi:hypothetical protein
MSAIAKPTQYEGPEGDTLPESLARRYEKFYHEVAELVGGGEQHEVLGKVQHLAKQSNETAEQLAAKANKASVANHNARALKKLFDLLNVDSVDEAVDAIAELKSEAVDPSELQNLRSENVGAQKSLRKIFDALGEDVTTASDAVTHIYALKKNQKEQNEAAQSSE